MSFRLHHSVVLDVPLSKAWHLLSSPDELPRLQESLPSLTNFVLAPISAAGPSSAPPTLTAPKADLLGLLASPSLPKKEDPSGGGGGGGVPWPDIDGSPEAPHFSFTEGGLASVKGTQVAIESHHAVLFHSRVSRMGIEEWKLRVLEELEGEGGGKPQVRVTETVWGTAPWLLAWYLNFSGKAQAVHKEHMELYHTLL